MYRKFLKMHIKSSWQYKTNMFYIGFSQIVISIAEILSVFILFQNFESVGYWGFYEAALMFGIITTVFSVVECFARGFDDFSLIIKNGELDRFLVRPVNMFYQIFGSKMEFSKLGKVILGIVVCIIAIVNLAIEWTVAKVFVLIATFICGMAVIFGVMLISAGISVFTVEGIEVLNIITNGSKEICYYPINIYSNWLKTIFTYIIPLACFNYLPISYIMGYGDLPSVIYALSPLFGILFVIPCFFFFKWSLKKYQGTGT